MGEQLASVRQVVRSNIKLAVDQLNRELELAEILRIPIAVGVDNTIGRPIRVRVIDPRVEADIEEAKRRVYDNRHPEDSP